MIIKKVLIGFFILILLMVIVHAVPYLGSDSRNFTGQVSYSGSFYSSPILGNVNYDASKISSAVLSKGKGAPVSGDIFGNGKEQIVVLDDVNLKIFTHGKTLRFNTSWTLESDKDYTNPYLYDINGDGSLEIIIAQKERGATINDFNIQIIAYNTTSDLLYNVTQFEAITQQTAALQDVAIGCLGVDSCHAFYQTIGSPEASYLSSTTFNSAGYVRETLNLTSTDYSGLPGTDYYACMPTYPVVAVADVDGVGTSEYVLTYYSKLYSNLLILKDHGNGTAYLSKEIRDDQVYNVNWGGSCSDNSYPSKISSPVVANFDGANNGLEIGYSYIDGVNYTNWVIYDRNGNVKDRGSYDIGQDNIEGDRVLNPVVGTFISDGVGGQDVCFTSYIAQSSNWIYDGEPALSYTCTNLNSGVVNSGFASQCTNYYQVSYPIGFDDWANDTYKVSYAVEMATGELNNNGDPTTLIITPLGVAVAPFCSDNGQYTNDVSIMDFQGVNASLMAADFDGTGRSDVVSLEKLTLFYHDDGFINYNSYVEQFCTDPCSDQTIGINQTVEVTVKVIDDESDNVRMNFSAYAGLSNEQSVNFSEFQISGYTFLYSFVANETRASVPVRLCVQDTRHLDSDSCTTVYYSVSTDGIGSGECNSCINYTNPYVTTTTTPEPVCVGDNCPVITGFEDIADMFGLTFNVLWIILMLGVAAGIFYFGYSSGMNGSVMGIIVSIVEILLLILGVKFGALSVGLLIVLVVISGAILAVFVFGKVFMPTKGS